jgi:uncharacterized protein
LAEAIKSFNQPHIHTVSLADAASKYLSEQVKSVEEAIKGASDILAEEVGENAEYRAYIRDYLMHSGAFGSIPLHLFCIARSSVMVRAGQTLMVKVNR